MWTGVPNTKVSIKWGLTYWGKSWKQWIFWLFIVHGWQIFNNYPAKSRRISHDTKIRWYSERLGRIVLLLNKLSTRPVKQWWAISNSAAISNWAALCKMSDKSSWAHSKYGKLQYSVMSWQMGILTICWIIMVELSQIILKLIAKRKNRELAVRIIEHNQSSGYWNGLSLLAMQIPSYYFLVVRDV